RTIGNGSAINASGSNLNLFIANVHFDSNFIASTDTMGNFGGAVFVDGGPFATVTIEKSVFTNNYVNNSGGYPGHGGAIKFNNLNTYNIYDSKFIGNYAMSGASAKGGAIITNDSKGTIESSLFKDGNAGSGGAAIYFQYGAGFDTTYIRNSTFYNNLGGVSQIHFESTTANKLELEHATIANSSVTHAIYGAGSVSAEIRMRASIIDNGDPALYNCYSASGPALISLGENISGPEASPSNECNLTGAGDAYNVNPQFGNAGNLITVANTEVLPLLAISPAKAKYPGPCMPGNDQTGASRPKDASGSCDAGAFQNP
ncbi:MAG: hypothetical protein KDD40_10330, partial [Bdellovibrionales bacterium]|nr:hypothetical protein [Bdellovibrionales bacterium]